MGWAFRDAETAAFTMIIVNHGSILVSQRDGGFRAIDKAQRAAVALLWNEHRAEDPPVAGLAKRRVGCCCNPGGASPGIQPFFQDVNRF